MLRKDKKATAPVEVKATEEKVEATAPVEAKAAAPAEKAKEKPAYLAYVCYAAVLFFAVMVVLEKIQG